MQAETQAADDGGAVGGEWSWQRARELQYLVLTTADARQREAHAADLFRALGQIMHLVVDASVPEHARNDPHPFGTLVRAVLRSRTAGNYEYWVSERQARLGDTEFATRYLSRPIGPDSHALGIAAPPDEAIAKAPVARLLDADRYRRETADPDVTLSGPIGIAEFANANFFSEDTLFGVDAHDRPLPFPRRGDLVRRSDLAPLSPRIRAYLEKPRGPGLTRRFALAECRLDGRAAALPPYPCVDEAVWDETAAHMLPRAVGYARGVLEYFFRGAIDVTEVRWNEHGLVVTVQNASDDQAIDGLFEIWARHHPGTSQERRSRFASLGEGAAIRLGPRETRVFERIAVPPDALPTSKYMLVFKGRMGLEEDAVAGRVFTVPHVDIRQNTSHAETAITCFPLSVTTATSHPKTTYALRSETRSCGWEVVIHRVSGTLTTNTPLDPATNRREPVIARIEARWPGTQTPEPIVLDGQPISGAWQRQGTEPDPIRFEVAARGRGIALHLIVSYTNGQQALARMAIFGGAGTSHSKTRYDDNRSGGTGQSLVLTRRATSGLVWYNLGDPQQPLFELLSHNGVPAGTARSENPREFGGLQFADATLVSPITYVESAIDDFEVLGRSAIEDVFKSIALQSPHPSGPVYIWEAGVRRTYSPMERTFLRAFVTTTPDPFVVTMTGQPASGGTQ